MTTYRCYFLDPNGHIEAAETIDAKSLDAAIEHAVAIFEQRSKHYSVEIWQGALRLYASHEAARPLKVEQSDSVRR